MTDSMHAAAEDPAAGIAATIGAQPTMFYIVSRRKATILFLGTLGNYSLYWFYKQWDHYKGNVPAASEFGTTVWLVLRAIFSVFFFHSLFRKVRQHGAQHPEVAAWRHAGHAWAMVALTLVSGTLDRVASSPMGSPLIEALSLLALLPLLKGMLRAQDMINLSCGDPEGDSNATLTTANFIWLGIGALLWASLVLKWLLIWFEFE